MTSKRSPPRTVLHESSVSRSRLAWQPGCGCLWSCVACQGRRVVVDGFFEVMAGRDFVSGVELMVSSVEALPSDGASGYGAAPPIISRLKQRQRPGRHSKQPSQNRARPRPGKVRAAEDSRGPRTREARMGALVQNAVPQRLPRRRATCRVRRHVLWCLGRPRNNRSESNNTSFNQTQCASG